MAPHHLLSRRLRPAIPSVVVALLALTACSAGGSSSAPSAPEGTFPATVTGGMVTFTPGSIEGRFYPRLIGTGAVESFDVQYVDLPDDPELVQAVEAALPGQV